MAINQVKYTKGNVQHKRSQVYKPSLSVPWASVVHSSIMYSALNNSFVTSQCLWQRIFCQCIDMIVSYLLMMCLPTKAVGGVLKSFRQYLLIFSRMLQNSLDGASHYVWTMTWSWLRKHPVFYFKPRSANLCNGQVNLLPWIRMSMLFTQWRQNSRENAPRRRRNEITAEACRAEHHQEWNPASGRVHDLLLAICCDLYYLTSYNS